MGRTGHLSVGIADEARGLFPRLGVRTLTVSGLRSAALAAALPAARERAAARMSATTGYDDVSGLPEVQLWRTAFAKMRLRPGAYRSSLESLMRAWTAGRSLQSELVLVDLYNLTSIAAAAPLGAVDRDRLRANNVILRFARPETDCFRPVGGSVKMYPRAQAVSYCVDETIICYALNHRDSIDYSLNADSDRAVFFAEWTCEQQQRLANQALEALADSLASAGATIGGCDRFGWAP